MEGNDYIISADGKDDDRVWKYQEEELDIADLQDALENLNAEYADSFTDEMPSGKEEISLTAYLDTETYDDLPLFLNADMVAKVLGVSSSTSYELMHEPDFPVLNVGSRMVVPKEAFIQWVTKHTEGGVRE